MTASDPVLNPFGDTRTAEAAYLRARVRGWHEHLRDGLFSAREQLDRALLDYAKVLGKIWPREYPFGRYDPDVAAWCQRWEREFGFADVHFATNDLEARG